MFGGERMGALGSAEESRCATWRAARRCKHCKHWLSLIAMADIVAMRRLSAFSFSPCSTVFLYFIMARDPTVEVPPEEVHHYNDIGEMPWDIQK